MAQLHHVAAVLLLLALSIAALTAPAAAFTATKGGMAGDLGAVVMRRGGRTCRGTVAECMEYSDVDAEGEGDVAAMITGKRRVLQGVSGYICYDALRRNSVPCSQRGASYYNCQPGAEANPYSRGCSQITQCRD
ncbi:rapid alkalinization factor-like [Phragmites australis]|uniref:rapid alkalinization factor-like n=1 Tax=Phragmites australis TaxID=29695 RepID=UPI002D779FB9|nr:rapid alkalinization factor-like [Phragmites australis]